MGTKTVLVLSLAGIAAMAAAQLSPQDRKFLKAAYGGSRAEVALGRLASAQGGTPSIRAFGRQMVADHSKAASEAQRLAYNKRVTVPTRLPADAVALRRKLTGLRGKAFDRVYREGMIEDHRKDIAEFQTEASLGRDPAVRAWARKTLPTLRMHLQMIQAARV